MNLSQQIEDKKKGCGIIVNVDNSDKGFGGWQCGQYYDSFKRIYYCKRCKAEIAILEQAITELQKQRQEILEDELKFLNLGKIKIEGKTKDMEFLIRKRIQYLKQQLNQPKTEDDK